MKKFISFFIVLALGLLSPGYAVAGGGKLILQSDIPFARDARTRESVKEECQLGTKLSSFIQGNYKGSLGEISAVGTLPKSGGKILSVEIVETTGRGGGIWGGGGYKSVTIKGKLSENGKTIGTFKGRRSTTGGAFAQFKGTCSLLGRCVKTLGQDVAVWLEKPKMKSVIGEGR